MVRVGVGCGVLSISHGQLPTVLSWSSAWVTRTTLALECLCLCGSESPLAIRLRGASLVSSCSGLTPAWTHGVHHSDFYAHGGPFRRLLDLVVKTRSGRFSCETPLC